MEAIQQGQALLTPSLEKKIEAQRRAALKELPKARLCAAVVLSVLSSELDFNTAIANLKAELGSNWSHVTAFQFMSGRQAKFSAECSEPSEQPRMLLAHHLAEEFCNQNAFEKLSFHLLKELALKANISSSK